ncbi:L,D-transpeptidase [Pseudorhizobium endolithicum]|uniref:L,D-transpeptidase n=1 Tax=Pseudorhizobium endolithicum TaxID=1191678 RepID=A0ABN7JHU4_9HYPH|nr:L,D-transpeptidase [Pseudorhizobium endolithicum]CAD7032090.1 L,D-transpeptidase [Pseudorhizobium endolithicum]
MAYDIQTDERTTSSTGRRVGAGLPRRSFILGVGAIAVSGCVSTEPPPVVTIAEPPPAPKPVVPPMYYAMPNERFPIPEVDISQLPPQFWRTEVDYPTDEKPGTLVVDTPGKYLYHVKADGRAMRYGIGVGRDGFAWAGEAIMAYRREWPRWTPPDSMVARNPELEPYSIANGGMDPGINNPLGARALYIHENGRDTLYRIHGSPEAFSIGKAVSSGCIRLINQDVIHLHDEVRDGSRIVVIPDPTMKHLLVG